MRTALPHGPGNELLVRLSFRERAVRVGAAEGADIMKKVFCIVGLTLALLFQAVAPALGAAGLPDAAAPGTYIVQPGDSLYRIAARQNVDFDALMAANGFTLDKVTIYPGQV